MLPAVKLRSNINTSWINRKLLNMVNLELWNSCKFNVFCKITFSLNLFSFLSVIKSWKNHFIPSLKIVNKQNLTGKSWAEADWKVQNLKLKIVEVISPKILQNIQNLFKWKVCYFLFDLIYVRSTYLPRSMKFRLDWFRFFVLISVSNLCVLSLAKNKFHKKGLKSLNFSFFNSVNWYHLIQLWWKTLVDSPIFY